MSDRPSQYAALDALYAELPTIECKGECHDSCGPIGMSEAEWHRIIARRGGPVYATGINCPLLRRGRCTVYAVRPTLCRLWGLVESMPCVYGCVPDRVLTGDEGHEFLRRAEAISEPEVVA